MRRKETDRINFTKRSIDAIHTPKAPKPTKANPNPKPKRVIKYDTAVKGLGIVVQPITGSKSFFWFRKVGGVAKWRTIGSADDLTVEQARNFAQSWNSKLASWKASDFAGPGPLESRADPTLAELLSDYCAKHLQANSKNPQRAIDYAKWQVDTYVPMWRNRKLHTIRPEDVRSLHRDLAEAHGQVTSNRVAQLVRTLYNFGRREGLFSGENPVQLTMFKESSRTRFLQPPELQRLFKALDSRSTPRDLKDFVKLSLFCGARRSDTLSMRWDQLDLERGVWHIPSPKNSVPYDVPLMNEAIEILKRRSKDSDWVFASVTSASGHLEDLKRNWADLLVRAEITDLKIHDLRRSFGSYQAALGGSLLIIGRSLGHASTAATSIYSRLQLDPIRTSVAAGVTAMLAAAKAKKPAVQKPTKRRLLKAKHRHKLLLKA